MSYSRSTSATYRIYLYHRTCRVFCNGILDYEQEELKNAGESLLT